MRHIAAILMLISSLLAGPAQAAAFETGWMQDQKGSVDTKTGTRVAMVVNMNGMAGPGGAMVWKMRHVGLELPLAALPAGKKIIVLGEDGRPMAHSDAEASDNPFDQTGLLKTYLKLYIEHAPGFRFRVRIE
jgi:hypothetical protein